MMNFPVISDPISKSKNGKQKRIDELVNDLTGYLAFDLEKGITNIQP